MKSQKSLAYKLSMIGAILIFSASLGAARLPQSGQQPAPDNTKTNQGDQNTGAMTADHQKMNPADRQTSQQIRGAIVKKSNIEAKAAAIAGADNVTDLLTVAPSK